MSVVRFVKPRLIAVLLILLLIPIAVTTVRGLLLIQALESGPTVHAATLFDVQGDILATLGRRRSAYVPFTEIPKSLTDAVIAMEDSRFWEHRGIDLIGLARAVYINLREGRPAQGASTITQQLAKNLFLTPEKTLTRKFQEAIYALLLESRFSKRRILEMYLNEVYYGEGAYGIEAAARTYFGKSTRQLTLAEGALLAGLLRAPSRYSPLRNQQQALERRSLVLERMDELGLISTRSRQTATSAPLHLAGKRGGQAPYFVDYVEAWLVERFGARQVFNSGLRVRTTLDPQVQIAAEEALGEHQGAVVALDSASGQIRALVGGRDYTESQFNRAVQSLRQPGSAFKPFVYAAALERGWQMNDLVEDLPRQYGDYAPQNFHHEYWGTVTLKHALVESLNNGSVWLLHQIGVGVAIQMARRLGVSTLTEDDRHLALALGGLTQGVSPLELTAAYVPLANGGIRHLPVAVLEVRDDTGIVLYRNRPTPRRVLSQEVAYFMTDILQEAVWRGTGSAANIGRPQAGKTGTTDHQVNAWFVGYTPDLVAGVYVGNDDRTPVAGGGGTLAAPIWGRMMIEALKGRPVTSFHIPDFVLTGVPVDIFTGLVANDACPFREFDSFVKGEQPVRAAPCTRGVAQRRSPFVARVPDHGAFDADHSLRFGGAPETPAADSSENDSSSGGTSPEPPPLREGPRLERAFDPPGPKTKANGDEAAADGTGTAGEETTAEQRTDQPADTQAAEELQGAEAGEIPFLTERPPHVIGIE